MTKPDLQSPPDYVCICHRGLSLGSLLIWHFQALTLAAFDALLWAHSSGFVLCPPTWFGRRKASSNTSYKSLAISILVFFFPELTYGFVVVCLSQ